MKRPALLLAPFVLLLAGCGGGGSSHSGGGATPAALGTATVSVAWPDRPGRLVPTTSNSVVVTLAKGTAVLTQTVPRPDAGGTSTASFSGLAYGAYRVTVRAFPTADGTGTAQAAGAGGLTVAEGVPGSASVALASTVAALTLAPNPLAFDKGTTATATVSATDASGAIVLLSVGDATEPLTWSVDAPANATLATSGLSANLTGIHSGSANLRVSMVVDDAGTVKTATAPITVNAIADGTGTVTVH